MLPPLSLMYFSSSVSRGVLRIKSGAWAPVVVDNDQVLVSFGPAFGVEPITDVSCRSNFSKPSVGIKTMRYATSVTPFGCSTRSVGT